MRRADGSEAVLPARAILVAAGTQPNTVLAREDRRITLDGKYFQAIDEAGEPVTPARAFPKPDLAQVLMHRAPDGRAISFFGDLHPSFYGNVVKAMGGAKRGYPVVSRVLAARDATPVSGPDADRALPRRADRDGARGEPADARPSSRSWCARRPPPAPSAPASSTGCRTTRCWPPGSASQGSATRCWRWRGLR